MRHDARVPKQPLQISCGVVVTDGQQILLGHASRSPRWDIPKGLAETGESHLKAAVRELREETGLEVNPAALRPLGTHNYLREKQLALFIWLPPVMPDPQLLRCSTVIKRPDGVATPELDRFGLFRFEDGLALVGRNLARVLAAIWPAILQGLTDGRTCAPLAVLPAAQRAP